MHALLKRQLKRHAPADEEERARWNKFVQAVDDAYAQHEADRAMLERSLELSSEELLQSNSELMAVFQALPDLFLRTTSDGTILERRGGDPHDPYFEMGPSLLGRKLQGVPDPVVSGQFERALDRVAQQQRLVTVEYKLQGDRGERAYEARLLPILGSQVMVIVRDISERKIAERALARKATELQRSNDELQQFAYVASHDLQEPLRTVQSYLQLLRRRYSSVLDDDANEFIDFAVEGAQRMRQLIQDLLAYARVTSRAKPSSPVALDDVLRQVLQALRASIAERKAEVTQDPLPNVLADASQLRQLLQNLIGNALKFCVDRAPKIHISAEQRGYRWVVSVKDNGIGMKPDLVDKIFIIFKRLHSRDEYEGTGIGLAICRKIVERHGGQLTVESTLGEGSTFSFDLPAAVPNEGSNSGGPASREPGLLGGSSTKSETVSA